MNCPPPPAIAASPHCAFVAVGYLRKYLSHHFLDIVCNHGSQRLAMASLVVVPTVPTVPSSTLSAALCNIRVVDAIRLCLIM